MPTALHLMGSKTTSDVVKAIDFFVTAKLFHLPQAEGGIRAMLPLIWSREPAIRDGVLEAYRRLFVGEEVQGKGPQAKKAALGVAASLIRLTLGASLSTLQSLAEYLTRTLHAKLLPSSIITALLDTFTASAGVTEAERQGALTLLAMIANTGEKEVAAALPLLLQLGLGENPALTRIACEALQRVLLPTYVAAGRLPPFHRPHGGLAGSCRKVGGGHSGWWRE